MKKHGPRTLSKYDQTLTKETVASYKSPNGRKPKLYMEINQLDFETETFLLRDDTHLQHASIMNPRLVILVRY